MALERKKISFKRSPLTYDQRYSLLYKYPRKSTFNEYYIKNNYLHKIRLSDDIDGLHRLRDRKKRVNYREDANKNTRIKPQATGDSSNKRRHSFKTKPAQLMEKTYVGVGHKTDHEQIYSSEIKEHKIFKSVDSNKEIIKTKFKQHQNTVTDTVNILEEQLSKRSNVVSVFDSPPLHLIKTLSADTIFEGNDSEKGDNDIVFVDGESSESDIDTVMTDEFNKYKNIKISLKEIIKISLGHECLTKKCLSKKKYCSICDIKLKNYIIQKKILSFNISKTLSSNEDDGINVILPEVTIDNGFKNRYLSFKKDFC
ncbi:hypothetical protein QEN19_002715 [Hanseniaspora menglaensis]